MKFRLWAGVWVEVHCPFISFLCFLSKNKLKKRNKTKDQWTLTESRCYTDIDLQAVHIVLQSP